MLHVKLMHDEEARLCTDQRLTDKIRLSTDWN
jgi:hypothetical protein